MSSRRNCKRLVAVSAPRSGSRRIASAALRRWNEVAIDSGGIDHTPVALGETRVFGG